MLIITRLIIMQSTIMEIAICLELNNNCNIHDDSVSRTKNSKRYIICVCV